MWFYLSLIYCNLLYLKHTLVWCRMNKCEHTCSSWRRDLCGQTSCWPDTPSLWPPAARNPWGLSLWGSVGNTSIRGPGDKTAHLIWNMSNSSLLCSPNFAGWIHLSCVCSYMCFITDEVAQVAVLHVGQDHQRWALRGQTDPKKRENVGVAEVLHDDSLFQELGHLFQVCDAFTEKKTI